MEGKEPGNRLIVPGVMALVVAVILGFVFFNRFSGNGLQDEQSAERQTQNSTFSSGNVSGNNYTYTDQDFNSLRGILLQSDDLRQGNLLLVRLEGDVYLNTTRDYSGLINKEVVVTVDGTLEKFRLIDIEPD
ncbi:MAG: hypothetical protein HYW51_01480 [Candidatus Doudnabacteria bacterium]|nr:hypothetical protein [Candidatus Doudnabacteria bacterium]